MIVVAHAGDRLGAEFVESLAEAARRYMDDPSRYPGMAEQAAQTERALARLRKLRRVDPADLLRPMTR